MEELSRALRLQRVEFSGAKYGADEHPAYGGASLVVLPSHTENFGLTVAEALAHGVPVVVSKGAPWQGVETEQCGWWVANDVGPLSEALSAAMQKPPAELAAMGARGRLWMERDYAWPRIGQMMYDTYAWLLGSGAAPGWVRLD